ncbi:response regulator transcription factor [Kangiella sediminilitoris]|uniref:DNA-binding heavy metal response regulator, putative n=1 Tax=Kangiella sediminilitoris TaxID=1144748 RepID=A0A1B3BDF6_9GAMM|nr:response regulator transcription factor [Kangiella sediminilitoris]AOE50842.1 DNA-binding heavy metal response regulator, putative [Kangiella sediminilitoris]
MSDDLKLLYLEDDQNQADDLLAILKDSGYGCTHCRNAGTFLEALKTDDFDLLIMDWELPDMSGIKALEQVRSFMNWKGPILFVTNRDSEQDIVDALEKGADDYMVKPFKRSELLARLSALIRKAGLLDDRGKIEVGSFTVDQSNRRVLVNGEPVMLTTKEYELAVILFKNVGRLFSRKYLLKHIWGIESDISTRTVDAHVSSLRKKLKIRADNGYRIKTVYQHGYRLERETEAGTLV